MYTLFKKEKKLTVKYILIYTKKKMSNNIVIDLNEDNYDKVLEGKATVYFQKTKNQVFYNPIQEFNRDLSIAGNLKLLLIYFFLNYFYKIKINKL
jgi:hypothetical protein